MATETAPRTPAAAKAGKKKSNRLVIIFDGRFEELFSKIEAKAKSDDRDMDTTVLRIVETAFNPPAQS